MKETAQIKENINLLSVCPQAGKPLTNKEGGGN
jgi:hypothetical protein